MREGERVFLTLGEVHAFTRGLSRRDLSRFTFQRVVGWRELLAATFGNRANFRYRGWFKS